MPRWVAYEVDEDYPLLRNAMLHEHLDCLYRGSSGGLNNVAKEIRI